MESHTLWTNPARTRYFRLPDGTELPLGKFVICTITGGKMEVDEAALTPFELSEEQAKAWIKSEFGDMLDGIRRAADRLVADLRARSAALDKDEK